MGRRGELGITLAKLKEPSVQLKGTQATIRMTSGKRYRSNNAPQVTQATQSSAS